MDRLDTSLRLIIESVEVKKYLSIQEATYKAIDKILLNYEAYKIEYLPSEAKISSQIPAHQQDERSVDELLYIAKSPYKYSSYEEENDAGCLATLHSERPIPHPHYFLVKYNDHCGLASL